MSTFEESVFEEFMSEFGGVVEQQGNSLKLSKGYPEYGDGTYVTIQEHLDNCRVKMWEAFYTFNEHVLSGEYDDGTFKIGEEE